MEKIVTDHIRHILPVLMLAAVACAAHAGGAPAAKGRLEVRRQDHGRFRLNRSVLDTPLRIGRQNFALLLQESDFIRAVANTFI